VRALRRLALGLLVAVALVGAAGGLAWWLSPSARELALLLGLASGVHPVQRASAKALADSPTDRSAIALVAFVNLTYRPAIDASGWDAALRQPSEVSDLRLAQIVEWLERRGCLPPETGVQGLRRLSDAERVALRSCAEAALRRYEAQRERSVELAEQGLLSLCQLTGHAFGTYYEPNRWNGYSWGSLDDERWAIALSELNGWAYEMFGREWLAENAASGLEAIARVLEGPRP
jgi:hypothetical protein